MSYIGNEPIVSATRTVTEVTATAGQTSFTPNGGYTVGFLDVFINGSKLTNTDFTATNGTTVTLNEAAQAGDIVRLEALGTFLTSSAMSNVNPSYTGTLTGGTGVVNIGSGQIYKSEAGNVGIGTSSPSSFSGFTYLSMNGSTGSVLNLRSNNTTQFEINTTGSLNNIQGITNIPLVFSTNNTERGRFDTSGNFLFNSGYGSVATAYGCRAWVNFNGTGTVAIRASGNVSSITDNGTGDYTVNFSTAMPDANYSTVTATSNNASGTSWASGFFNGGTYSTSQVRFATFNQSALGDSPLVSVAVFR